VKPAEGIGQCAAEESRARRQLKSCLVTNDKKEEIKCGGEGDMRKCSGKIDLVLLVDNSGESDVDENKKAAEKVLNKLDMSADKVKVSVVSVAGLSFMDSSNSTFVSSLSSTGTDDGSAKCLLQWGADSGQVFDSVKKIPQGTGPFSIYKGLSVALNLFNSPGARQDAKAQLVVITSSNILEDYQQLSLLQSSRFSPHYASFLKVGGLEAKSAAEKAWKKLSIALNRGNAKATINRTLYNLSSYEKVEKVVTEHVVPNMCGEGLA